MDMLKDDFDEEMASMVEDEVTEANKEYETFEVKLLLSHPYDKNNAILELHPGPASCASCSAPLPGPAWAFCGSTPIRRKCSWVTLARWLWAVRSAPWP